MTDYPNLRHIRLLTHAFALNSLTGAAEVVGISQPAASQAVSRLESQFGGQLFERSANGIHATARGRLVASRSERLFALIREAGAMLARESQTPSRRALETRVTISHLRAVAAFGQGGSFAGAARRLGQMEASIQRAIRELEQVAAVPLVESGNGPARLTPLGVVLAGTAGRALRELDNALQDVAELDGRYDGQIVVGTLPLVRTRIVPRAVAAWSARHPQASVEIIDAPYDVLLGALGMGAIDALVGALRESPPPRGFVQETLFTDGLRIVARADHPLAGRNEVTPADLDGCSWVLPRKGTPTRELFDALARRWGLEACRRGLVETGSLVTIRGILAETDRLTILSLRQIAHEHEAGLLVALPIALPSTERPIGVTTRQGWQPTTIQKDFLAALESAAGRP